MAKELDQGGFQFSGLLEEECLRGISIDRFDGENCDSVVYFLTHLHTDHMYGLSSLKFRDVGALLYCSEVTAKLLHSSKDFTHFSSKVVSLKICKPYRIVVPMWGSHAEYSIKVTLLPALHCIGSVMIYIETGSMNVLFTGDIRLDKDYLNTLKALHYKNSLNLKPIHRLYIDATFFHPDFMWLPTQEESSDAVVKLISEWINQSKDNYVCIDYPIRFGAEHLFIELRHRTGQRIHVHPSRYADYKGIHQDMEDSVTLDKTTQVHCCYRHCSRKWDHGMHFRDDKVVAHVKERIFYSIHSSGDEVVEIVKYLNPKHVSLIARPKREDVDLSDDEIVQMVMGTRDVSLLESYHSHGPQHNFNRELQSQSNLEIGPSAGMLGYYSPSSYNNADIPNTPKRSKIRSTLFNRTPDGNDTPVWCASGSQRKTNTMTAATACNLLASVSRRLEFNNEGVEQRDVTLVNEAPSYSPQQSIVTTRTPIPSYSQWGAATPDTAPSYSPQQSIVTTRTPIPSYSQWGAAAPDTAPSYSPQQSIVTTRTPIPSYSEWGAATPDTAPSYSPQRSTVTARTPIPSYSQRGAAMSDTAPSYSPQQSVHTRTPTRSYSPQQWGAATAETDPSYSPPQNEVTMESPPPSYSPQQ